MTVWARTSGRRDLSDGRAQLVGQRPDSRSRRDPVAARSAERPKLMSSRDVFSRHVRELSWKAEVKGQVWSKGAAADCACRGGGLWRGARRARGRHGGDPRAEPERETRYTFGRDQTAGSFRARRRRAEVTPSKSPAAGLGKPVREAGATRVCGPGKTFLPQTRILKRGGRAPRRRDRSRRPLGNSRPQRGPTPRVARPRSPATRGESKPPTETLEEVQSTRVARAMPTPPGCPT